jgi:late competence protein required for DNA uptake (superfamily II DNA/RNA helicase)
MTKYIYSEPILLPKVDVQVKWRAFERQMRCPRCGEDTIKVVQVDYGYLFYCVECLWKRYQEGDQAYALYYSLSGRDEIRKIVKDQTG